MNFDRLFHGILDRHCFLHILREFSSRFVSFRQIFVDNSANLLSHSPKLYIFSN